MTRYDEPPIEPNRIQDAEPRAVREQIRALIDEQPFAVLCTQGGGQPYGSLIAFAPSDDLLAIAFATPVASPVNTLVMGAGDYRFGDYIKVGVPLIFVTLIAAVLLLPVLFPF